MQIGLFVLNQKQKVNSVELDETARYEPSHLDLHCLYKYLFWYAWLVKTSKGCQWIKQ